MALWLFIKKANLNLLGLMPRKKAIDELDKYKKSKIYEEYVLRKQFIELLKKQNATVERRVELLSNVIVAISDDDTDIVNKKG